MSKPFSSDRRHFLRRSGAAAMVGAVGPWAMNLAAMAEAAAAQSTDDYKALVCVFLQGGNDHANTLIPYDTTSHAQYVAARAALAIPRTSLHGTALTPSNASSFPGRQMALAPSLFTLKSHFDDGKLAMLLNIGPLLRPTTLDDVRNNRSLPPKLFSHNDQQAVWQSFHPEGALTGWGGLIAEQGLPSAASRSPGDNLTCVNLSGNAVFLNGVSTSQYMVNPMGLVPLRSDARDWFGVTGLSTAFEALSVNVPDSSHWMARQHASVMKRAREVNGLLGAAMDAPGATIRPLTSVISEADYEERRLSLQLNMVARMIEARQALGRKRQVFLVALGGFDHHDGLPASHPTLLRRVGEAMSSFQDDLAALGVSDQVTTFTASDFGRTMNSNGDGSDHGWGSYHFVMGGAVRGGRFYGQLPDVVGGTTDIGQGRLLPTMAVDHLSAALARWMGVTDSAAMARIAPNLSNWAGVDPLSTLMNNGI